MFVDYHVHLDKIEWSLDSISQMCERACDAGVDKIGIVIHTKNLKGFEPLYDHVLRDGLEHKKLKFDRDIESYIKLLRLSKDRGYPVEIGLEVCYSPEGESFLREKLKQYDFDYTIGSVHLIGNKHFKTAVECYGDCLLVGQMYYSLVLKAIESGMFNIIGHIEVARREGVPGLECYPQVLDSICTSLTKNNCAVEINTKWLTKREHIVPEKYTLSYMAKRGVKLVFGSDAHHKSRIGYAMDNASAAIRDAGYKRFSTIDT